MTDNPFRTSSSGPVINFPSDGGKVIAVGADGTLAPGDAAALVKYPIVDAGKFLRVALDGSAVPSDALQPLLDLFFHTVNPADLWDSDATRPAFAELHFSTPDTAIELTVTGDLSTFTDQREIAVFVDGVPTVYSIPDGGGIVSVPLTAGTTKQIILREGTKAWALIGCIVTAYVCRGSVVAQQPAPARRLVVVGDSIACGFSCSHPTLEAWSQLIRADGVYSVTCLARGGDAATGLPNLATPAFDGTSENVLWIALGYNDYSGQTNPATVATAYAEFIDRVHAAHPDVQVICQTPITAAVEVGVTYSLGDYRTAIANLIASRPWARVVDGTTIVTAPLVDGIHPGTAGNATYAAAVRTILGQTVEALLQAETHSFWLKPDVGRTVVGGVVTAWTDAMGNGYDVATAPGSLSPPLDGSMGNNTPAVTCDGEVFMGQVGAASASTSHTYCYLLDETSNTHQQLLASGFAPEANINGKQGIYQPGVAHVEITGSATVLGPQVLCFVLSGDTYTVYRNGVQAGQIAGQTPCTFSALTVLGTADGGGSICMRGKVASIAYCDDASTDLVTAFTAWAMARAAIA